jgi:hypothetical protein
MTVLPIELTHGGLHVERVGIEEDRARISHDGGVDDGGTAGDVR